jgi:hypothetical protein
MPEKKPCKRSSFPKGLIVGGVVSVATAVLWIKGGFFKLEDLETAIATIGSQSPPV